MDKEKLITIGIGLAVGVTAAAIYFLATRYLPGKLAGQNKVTFTPTTGNQQPAASNQLSITLDKPDDHTSTTAATTSISGRTQPGVKLILFSNADGKVASADGQGKFSFDIKLEEGENEISVTAIDSQSNFALVKRNVTLEISQ